MDDLASVVSSAIKPARVASDVSLRPQAALSPQEQAKSDAFERSPGNIRELQAAIAAEKNPQNRAELEQELRTQSGDQSFGDLTSVVGSALTEAHSSTLKESAQPAQPVQKEDINKALSFGASAGKAVGTGFLGLQQLVGKGISYLGDVQESVSDKSLSDLVAPQKNSLQKIGDWLNKDAIAGVKKLSGEADPYEKANPKTALAGEVFGAVASPINKLVPGLGASSSVVGAGIRGGIQGALLNTLTAPVTDDGKPFITEKIKQAGLGFAGGTFGGALGYGLSKAINSGIEAVRSIASRATPVDSAKVADELVTKSMDGLGIPRGSVTPELFDGLKAQVVDAVKSGKPVDEAALMRLTQSQTLPVPVPMMKGQITRDPMQFAKEQNLRGIRGVGEPIQETMRAQNKSLIANLDALGANKGADVVTAGKNVMTPLEKIDADMRRGVSAAYDAFKNATGRELDIPIKGLAQDYASIIKERGSSIPIEVKREFESYGLLGGKQLKNMTISEAEGLIQNFINKNYDPSNKIASGALNDLRKAVEKSIEDGAGKSAEGGPAAKLALAARRAARERFALIESTPALKDVVRGVVEPDKFVQKHILQGNEAEIKSLVKTLSDRDPKALEGLQDSVMGHIKAEVLNGRSAENGVFSQAKLKNFVTNPNMAARLEAVLGPKKMGTLRQLNNVAEDVLYDPVASAVNKSNTTSAAANLVKSEVQGGALNKMLEIGKRFPVLSMPAQMAQQGVQSSRASALIEEAVNPNLRGQSGENSVLAVLRAHAPDPTRLGSRTGASYVGAKSRQKSTAAQQ